jgi:hypothetical protein
MTMALELWWSLIFAYFDGLERGRGADWLIR